MINSPYMLLALDLSSFVGYAVGRTNDRPAFGTYKVKGIAKDLGPFCVNFNTWLRADMIARYRPDRIVFESPVVTFFKTTKATSRMLMGLCWHVEFVCAELGIECREGAVRDIKGFWASNRNAKKPDMIQAALNYGFAVSDDNQADALGLWHMSAGQAKLTELGALGARAR